MINRLLFLSLAIIFLNSCKKDSSQIINNPAPSIPVADAGPSKYITLPVNSTTLNGIGNSANGPIVGYLWSLISGPNVPVIHSPSSSNTLVSGLIGGNYNLQFMVIDSLGYTGVDTTWIHVAIPPSVTLTLQPTANPVEINFAGYPTILQDGSCQCDYLDAGTWTNGGVPLYLRGAFKFDLSSIPAGSTILSAKLSLYTHPNPINGDLINANSGPNNSMWIRRLQSAFSGTSTWFNQPSTESATQALVPHTSLSFLDVPDIDVKDIVSSMMTNGNYGFMMGLQNETQYNIRQFASSRHSNAAKHPKLVVVYQ